jgi:hypothetical protein
METNFIEAEKKCYNIKVPELKNIVLRNILHQKKEGICITAPKDNNKDTVSFEKLDQTNSPNIPNDLIQEQNQMLNRPWNKLEKGLKINRVKDFIKQKNKEWGLNKKNLSKLEKLIISKIHRKVLSKKNDVNYDEESGQIIDIPTLQFTKNEENIITGFRIANKRTSSSRSPGKKKNIKNKK